MANSDTLDLLRETSSGSKMAIHSIDHVVEYVKSSELRAMLESYKSEHEKIEARIGTLIKEMEADNKEPSVMAKAMAWMSADFKLKTKEPDKEAAKIMMDGCNMGIQSVSEFINKYKAASEESITLAKKLITIEEHFMTDMKKFL